MPDIPLTVWEQIQVVIVFALLLAGLATLMVKVFTNAIDKINANYTAIVEKTNKQWQLYFDAKCETGKLLDGQTIQQLENLTQAVQRISDNQDVHDLTMRQALDKMEVRRRKLVKTINK